MNKKFYSPKIFLYFLLLFPILISAQNAKLKGKVLDNADAPLELAAIALGTNGLGAYADAEGKYEIEAPAGEYDLLVQYNGYSTYKSKITLKAGETFNLVIKLEAEGLNMNTQVITGSNYSKRVAEEVVSMEVVGKDMLKNTQIRDVGEALNRTSGVIIQDGQISIRGGNAYSYGVGSRVLMLSDGLPFMSADLGEANIKMAPIEITEQMEVIKGASSVLYGSSALNGVVNIRTRWPSSDKPRTELNMYAGTFARPDNPSKQWWNLDSIGPFGKILLKNTFSPPLTHSSPTHLPSVMGYMFSHEQQKGNWQWVIGGYNDRFQSYLEKNDEYRNRLDLKVRRISPKIPGLKYGFTGNFMKEESQRFFFSKDLDTNAYRMLQGSDDLYYHSVVNPFIHYHDSTGNSYTLDARYIVKYRSADPSAFDNGIIIKPQAQRNFGKHIIVTAGVPLTWGISRSNLYPGWRKSYMFAGFLQGELKYTRLSLVGGVRYESLGVDTVRSYTKPIFRAGINYQPARYTFLKANFGQAYRMPTVGERFISTSFTGNLFVMPTPSLKSETGWTSEIGITQGFKIGKMQGGFEGTFFWNEFQNYVEYEVGVFKNRDDNDSILFPGQPEYILGMKPRNIAQVRIAGIELKIYEELALGKFKIRSNWGYTYTYPGNMLEDSMKNVARYMKYFVQDWNKSLLNDTTAGHRIQDFRSRHLFRGDAEAIYDKFSLGTTITYTSFPEKFSTLFLVAIAFLTQDLDGFQKYGEEHAKGDWIVNARLGYQINDKLRFGFVVNNMSNREYFLRPGKLEAPRSYQVQLRFLL